MAKMKKQRKEEREKALRDLSGNSDKTAETVNLNRTTTRISRTADMFFECALSIGYCNDNKCPQPRPGLKILLEKLRAINTCD